MDDDADDKPCKRLRVTLAEHEQMDDSLDVLPGSRHQQDLPDLVPNFSGDGISSKHCSSDTCDIEGLVLPSGSAQLIDPLNPDSLTVKDGGDCFDDETGETIESEHPPTHQGCTPLSCGQGNVNNSCRCVLKSPCSRLAGEPDQNSTETRTILEQAVTDPNMTVTFGFSKDSVMVADEDADIVKPGSSQECNAIAENSYIRSVEQLKFESKCVQDNSVSETYRVGETPLVELSNVSSEAAGEDFSACGQSGDTSELFVQPPGDLSDTGFIDMFESESSVLASSSCFTNSEVMSDILNKRKPTMTSKATYTSTLASTSTSKYPTNYEIKNDNHFLACQKPDNQPFELDSDFFISICRENNINGLPVSVIVQIFRHLSPCTLLRCASCVCKYWYNLCRDPDLWRNINMRNQHKLTDTVLGQLLNFSDRVLCVNLTDCRFVTDIGVRMVAAGCLHLRSLKLMRCFDLTDETFAGWAERKLCSNLQYLHLDGCYKLTDTTILEVAAACHDLRQLHVNQCTKVTDTGITTLAQNCPRLAQLLLDHCDKVTDKSITELVRCCPDLQYLNLMSCGVTDDGVRRLAQLSSLRNLDLSNMPRITPRAVAEVSRWCKLLECVNISLNSVMDDQTVSQLARNGENLRRLYCVSCSISDTGLADIAKYRPQMEALDIGWCQDITDEGVRLISRSCPRLGYLGLIRCDRVTVTAVEELVLQYPHINYSTFILESRRLIERARREGFQFGLPKKLTC